MMHLPWARQLLDKREFVLVEGRHPSSDPNHGRDDAGYDSEDEERDLHHQREPKMAIFWPVSRKNPVSSLSHISLPR